LRPARSEPPKQLAPWIGALDDPRFPAREQAMRELEGLGDGAELALLKALAGPLSLEAQRRVRLLVDRLKEPRSSPESLRAVRAIEILVDIGTSEARRALEGLALGEPQLRLTQEANAALRRLDDSAANVP
jgi:hypothetical protein